MRVEGARLAVLRGLLRGHDWRAGNRGALEILEPIMVKTPAYPKAWILAGHAYTNLDRLDDAERVLRQAHAIPEADADPWLHSNWGWVLYRMGRVDEARAATDYD